MAEITVQECHTLIRTAVVQTMDKEFITQFDQRWESKKTMEEKEVFVLAFIKQIENYKDLPKIFPLAQAIYSKLHQN